MTHIHRTHRWLLASAAALAVALLPEVAAAQQKSPPQDTSPQALFVRIDTNSDGKVSKEEATRLPSVATRWEELDKNNDGWLSREEFIAGFRT
jgi:Ca2+-binding EF-hand superfamily protein